MTQSQVNELYRDPELAPLTDRATSGLYPTGSIYKIITALAALESGVVTPSTTIQRQRLHRTRRAEIPERRRRLLRTVDPGPGPAGLLRRLLLRTRPRDVADQRPPALVARARRSASRPGSTCPKKPKAWSRANSGATSSTPKAKPTGPGRRATTSSWRSGRGTCRPTRCRWRSPTRRSATAAPSSPRTSGSKSRTRPAGCCSEFDPEPRRKVKINPTYRDDDPRRSARGRAGPGGHLLRRLRRLPDPGRRQDRHRGAPAPRRPVLVRGAGSVSRTPVSSPS